MEDPTVVLLSVGEDSSVLAEEIEKKGLRVVTCPFSDAEETIEESDPLLIVLHGARGAVELSTLLEDNPGGRPQKAAIVAPRKDLAQLMGLNRDIVVGLVALEMTEKTAAARIEALVRQAAKARGVQINLAARRMSLGPRPSLSRGTANSKLPELGRPEAREDLRLDAPTPEVVLGRAGGAVREDDEAAKERRRRSKMMAQKGDIPGAPKLPGGTAIGLPEPTRRQEGGASLAATKGEPEAAPAPPPVSSAPPAGAPESLSPSILESLPVDVPGFGQTPREEAASRGASDADRPGRAHREGLARTQLGPTAERPQPPARKRPEDAGVTQLGPTAAQPPPPARRRVADEATTQLGPTAGPGVARPQPAPRPGAPAEADELDSVQPESLSPSMMDSVAPDEAPAVPEVPPAAPVPEFDPADLLRESPLDESVGPELTRKLGADLLPGAPLGSTSSEAELDELALPLVRPGSGRRGDGADPGPPEADRGSPPAPGGDFGDREDLGASGEKLSEEARDFELDATVGLGVSSPFADGPSVFERDPGFGADAPLGNAAEVAQKRATAAASQDRLDFEEGPAVEDRAGAGERMVVEDRELIPATGDIAPGPGFAPSPRALAAPGGAVSGEAVAARPRLASESEAALPKKAKGGGLGVGLLLVVVLAGGGAAAYYLKTRSAADQAGSLSTAASVPEASEPTAARGERDAAAQVGTEEREETRELTGARERDGTAADQTAPTKTTAAPEGSAHGEPPSDPGTPEGSPGAAATPPDSAAPQRGTGAAKTSFIKLIDNPFLTPDAQLPGCSQLAPDAGAQTSDPVTEASGHWSEARRLIVKGDIEGASRVMCVAVAINPQSPAVEGLARLYALGHSPKQAMIWVEKALALAPESRELITLRGDIKSQLGRHDEATEDWLSAMGLGPDEDKRRASQAHVFATTAKGHRSRGDLPKAEQFYRRALGLDPRNITALAGIAEVMFERKLYDHAGSFAIQALEVFETMPETHVVLGDIALVRNETESARASYQRALAIRPDFWPAKKKLRDLSK